MAERIDQLLARLSDYSWWEVALEVAVLWLLVYAVLRFVRGTRAAGALKGMVILFFGGWLVIRLLSLADLFPRLAIIYNLLLGYAAIALVVTFQPELRRALIRLGETPLLRGSGAAVRPIVDAVTDSMTFLSKNRFGAIIAIERQVGLRDATETGRTLNADLSSELLSSIFWPNSPLHDMGVVIRGSRVLAAGVQFPLADPGDMPDGHLGTRHRAAVGLARSTDAIVIVVSEETGAISLADGSQFLRWLTPQALREHLLRRLGGGTAAAGPPVTETPDTAFEAQVDRRTKARVAAGGGADA
jgi:diadenylate cyclase